VSLHLVSNTAAFRAAMAAFTTGVTVVTTATEDGDLHGATVNSFASVSLDPMLVLVCLRTGSHSLGLIQTSGVFGVNVLSAGQEDVSGWFASRQRPADSSMFDGFDFDFGATGCPLLPGTAASFDCTLHELFPGGDHTVVIGEVAALRHHPDRAPLVFHGGDYKALTRTRDAGLIAV
jgi:flavin reductase (DIM6/NTAB) family NADH-FMN oxidoreductase RutF